MNGFFPSTLVDRFTDPTIPITVRELFVFGSVAPFMFIDFVAMYVKKPGEIFLGMKHELRYANVLSEERNHLCYDRIINRPQFRCRSR